MDSGVELGNIEAANGGDTTEKIRERLGDLKAALDMLSAFEGDSLSWAAGCIQAYLDGKEKTLDHAFGLRTTKRGPKAMESGVHDDWVVDAFAEVFLATPKGKDWPSTNVLASIGRKYPIRNDIAYEDNKVVAAELKTILTRYRNIIIKSLSNALSLRMNQE